MKISNLLGKARDDAKKNNNFFCGSYIADADAEYFGNKYNHMISCEAGDLIVIVRGPDAGSIEQEVNYGQEA